VVKASFLVLFVTVKLLSAKFSIVSLRYSDFFGLYYYYIMTVLICDYFVSHLCMKPKIFVVAICRSGHHTAW